MFHQWQIDRNKRPDLIQIWADLDDLSILEKSTLSYTLCCLITEIKKISGEDFPPKTLYEMIICVQMYLETHTIFWKLLDDTNPAFTQLKFTCNNIIKERASGGLGSVVRQAEVLSYEDEDFLWQNGYLGTLNPEQLLRTLVFVLGIHCALRAGGEHHNLCSMGFNSQFYYTFPDGIRHIVYNEDLGQKTNKGGLCHKKIKSKEVTIFLNLEDRSQCPVSIFYKYHSRLPLKCNCSALYLRPRKVFTDDAWFQDSPVGINKLCNVVKDLTREAGLNGNFTNYSLRLMAATCLYQGGVEEQVICELTGHHSLSIQLYKCTHDSQKMHASDVLKNNPVKKWQLSPQWPFDCYWMMVFNDWLFCTELLAMK